MKNVFSLLIIGVAGFKLVQSFMHPENATIFLGMDTNIWLFRLIWVLAALLSGYSIMRERNTK